MSDQHNSRYKEAGVDIDKGNAFVHAIKGIISSTHQAGVVNEIGGFSSLFSIENNTYEQPVLVASTDGVGTKLAVANLCGKHDTIGIDLVAMCVNDIIVSGARPLFFLDYFSVGRLDLDVATEVVKGIAEGCIQAQCSLVGGETAEMPGLYKAGDYDLAGFVTGIVDRKRIIDGSRIMPGDRIIGLPSSGLHSNGFSLVRKICFTDLQLRVESHIDDLGCSLGEELLRPTRIYVRPVLEVLERIQVNGMVHNTGGGFFDNIPRVLPKSCRAVIDGSSWTAPPVFSFLAQHGRITEQEMYRTFNMGIGYMLVVPADQAGQTVMEFSDRDVPAAIIGTVEPSADGIPEVLINR